MTPNEEVLPVYLVHWNAPEWCASSARSILDSEGVRVDLTVIDNGQEEGPPLEEVLPGSVRLLRTSTNMGYSGGANLAIQEWLRRLPGIEFCVVGSHDLHVRRDTLKKLVRAAGADKMYGVLAPALASPYAFSGGYWTGWRGGQIPLDGVRGVVERDWVPGGCMLLRRECVESIGGFDEAYGSYVEDVDFGLRARDAGWKVGVVSEAVSWGLGSASSNAGPMMVANRVLLVAKRGGVMPGTARALMDLGSLGLRTLGSLVGALIWNSPAGRHEYRVSLSAHRRTLKRILDILGWAWGGRIEDQPARTKHYQKVAVFTRSQKRSRDDRTATDLGKPIATVVIATRDRPDFATIAVESALQQTIHNIEVVVVDDGSLEPYEAPHYDERLRILRLEQPSGTSAARNSGMKAAQGQWITFLDEGDELLPDMLEKSLRAAAESRLSRPIAVLSAMEVLDEAGRVVSIRVPTTRPRGRFFSPEDGRSEFSPTNTLVVPRAVLMAAGGWDESIIGRADDELFLRLTPACSIQSNQELTLRTRAHDHRERPADHLARAEGIAHTLRKHRGVFDIDTRARSRFLAEMGKSYLKGGRWLPALTASTRAFMGDPKRPYALRQLLGSFAGPHVWSWYVRRRLSSRATPS